MLSEGIFPTPSHTSLHEPSLKPQSQFFSAKKIMPLVPKNHPDYRREFMSSPASPTKKSCVCSWPLFSSPIGRKWIVAITGIILILFVIGHLIGNFSIFLGPDSMNSYAHLLQNLGELLWLVRGILLACVVLHIWFTITLWRENLTARPQKYAVKNTLQTTIYARSMRLSGLVVLAFVLYHLAQFTWQSFNPEYRTWVDSRGYRDVYRMVVTAFSCPLVSAFYIIAVGLLGMHLSHGIASLFQTLGITTAKMRPVFEKGGKIVAWIIFLGFASIPASVLLGFVKVSPSLPACPFFCH
jgi:succinate dehydrogenase / fumarate reductase cytochrome b subunit